MNAQLPQLKILRDFQAANPDSHACGSIGLLLRGIDLKRDLQNSDIDIVSPTYRSVGLDLAKELEGLMEEDSLNMSKKRDAGSSSDFDNQEWIDDIKVEVRISSVEKYDVVMYEGHSYNVSKLSNILVWKKKYAEHNEKHTKDIENILDFLVKKYETI